MCLVEGEDNPPKFFRELTPLAHKQHQCGECGRVIRPGERYIRASGKWDDRTSTHKICAHCRIAAEWLNEACGGYLFGAVHEDFAEHATGSFSMLRIVVGSRRRWRSFADPAILMPIPAEPALTP